MRILLLSVSLLLSLSPVQANSAAKPPSPATAKSAAETNALPSIAVFSQDLKAHTGLFDWYYRDSDGRLFLVIKQTGQPFIFQSSLPRGIGSNDIGLDRGQLGETRLVQFERFGNKVLLRQLNSYYQARSQNLAEQQSVREAFASSVLASLPIVAQSSAKDGAAPNALLVDYTDFLTSDIHQVARRLAQSGQGDYQADASRSGVYLPRSKAFARNTELEALVTFSGKASGDYIRQVTPAPDAVTVHLHHSLIALPDEQYQPRAFHPYSGYWKIEYQDYASAIDEPMTKRLLPRHRLQKQNPAAAQSPAVAPIVYYLDPGVPEPVRTALKEGALWWDQAFAKLGYLNAFQVKDLPLDADPMDIRYNVIQWVHRASRGWSYGSTVTDPRTGEIMKGHVTLGSLRVRQDFLIATGLTAPYPQSAQDGTTNTDATKAAKAMALARIRQLSAHEVGHTLGLIHNFAGSANGRSTVMDYPHPMIDLRDGKPSVTQAYREGLGEWDLYAIAYGYGDHSDDERQTLVRNAKAAGLEYMADEDARPEGGVSAIGHLWDNGANPVDELTRLGKVRAAALQQFGLGNIANGQPLSSLQEALVPIYLLQRYQVEAVSKLLGGSRYHYELKGDFTKAQGITAVDKTQQLAALDALLATVQTDYLQLPASLLQLIPPKAYGDADGRESFSGRTGLAFDPLSAAEAAASHTLSLLLHPERLNRLQQQQLLSTVLDKVLAQTLNRMEDGDNMAQLLSQRVGHVAFYHLMQQLTNPAASPEVRAVLWQKLHNSISAKRRSGEASLALLASQWQWYLERAQWTATFVPKALPPGAPI